MSQDFNQYLTNILSNIENPESLKAASKYTDSINQIINKHLQQQKIKLGAQKVVSPKKQNNNKTKIEQELMKINQKKEEALQLLFSLQKIEYQKKLASRTPPKSPPKQRSQMTKQDIKILKKLLKRKQKLQKLIEMKDEQIQKQGLLLKESDRMKQQQEIEQKRKFRRQKTFENIQKLKDEQQFRRQQYKRTQQLLDQIKKNNYLYKKVQEAFNQQEQKQKMHRQQQYKKIKRLKQISLEDIKTHQQKYKQIIQKNKQQRQKKVQYIRSQSMHIKYHLNPLIQKQENQIKNQFKQKSESPKKYKKRILQYSQKIYQDHKQKLKPKSTTVSLGKIVLPSIKKLTKKQVDQIGQSYLLISKKLSKKRNSLTITPSESPSLSQKNRYQDYTKKLSPQILDRQKELSLIRNILDKKVDQNGIHKAHYLANLIQYQSRNNSNRLANSIQAKIDILNKIT